MTDKETFEQLLDEAAFSLDEAAKLAERNDTGAALGAVLCADDNIKKATTIYYRMYYSMQDKENNNETE